MPRLAVRNLAIKVTSGQASVILQVEREKRGSVLVLASKCSSSINLLVCLSLDEGTRLRSLSLTTKIWIYWCLPPVLSKPTKFIFARVNARFYVWTCLSYLVYRSSGLDNFLLTLEIHARNLKVWSASIVWREMRLEFQLL
ncbi:hypothetical protein PoB_004504800 [Plakobranchus ocellatus]|uniref:Uncharacterized protein n=1 Tax=Plakobranchus ocellatus TaxID=259542 RepID=A0AAV4BHA7_9GAST|nr:hypothetical protein PoB_004504800 [Plakobranchus ocellatus]